MTRSTTRAQQSRSERCLQNNDSYSNDKYYHDDCLTSQSKQLGPCKLIWSMHTPTLGRFWHLQLSSESLTGKKAPITQRGGKMRPPRNNCLCNGHCEGSGGPKNGIFSYLWYDLTELVSLGNFCDFDWATASFGERIYRIRRETNQTLTSL